MGIVWTIIIGFFVGLVARFIMPGKDKAGFILTTILGILGAVIGGYIGQALGFYTVGEPAGFIMSVLGALILLFIIGKIRK
ncbi:GlsB/YeaQ/YmgE family stress response membrane protein [Bdellovibrio bacteriovorus]